MNDFLQSLRNGQAEKSRVPKTRKNYDNSYHYSNTPRYHNYSGGYQNTRNQNMKRPSVPQGPMGNQMPVEDQGLTMLADAIENLASYVETLVKNQEYMASVQERSAEMLERQAIAIERIVNHLNIEPLPENQDPQDPVFENHYVTSRDPEGDMDESMPSDQATAEFQEPVQEPSPAPEPEMEMPRPTRRVVRKRKRAIPQEQAVSTASSSKLLSREEVMDIINTMRDQGATYDQVARHLIELGQPTFSGRGEWHAQTIHRLCSK